MTNKAYITVTVHYIHKWVMVNRILATREMVGIKDNEYIRNTVEGILQVSLFLLGEWLRKNSIHSGWLSLKGEFQFLRSRGHIYKRYF